MDSPFFTASDTSFAPVFPNLSQRRLSRHNRLPSPADTGPQTLFFAEHTPLHPQDGCADNPVRPDGAQYPLRAAHQKYGRDGSVPPRLCENTAGRESQTPPCTHIPSPQTGKKGIHLRNPVYHRQDIQNGLGPKPRHRCTADVRNGNQLIPQDLPDPGGFFFIAGWSSGIIGNHPHFYGAHQKCVRIAARGISL